ncbi:wax ester/triacylglycerol synthase domain-containing protein [Mycolicibacterium sp. CBM1]
MSTEPQEHRLEFLDQTAFEMMRATGRGQLMQCVWVYEHPVDIEGLRRFHRNFTASLGSRLIETSPLPFGRPRWVTPLGPPPPIRFSENPRPRSELMDWADELATLPIDPEHGPGWYLVVQPLTDGSTAISMLGSHCIGDGVGALLAIFEAVTGNIRDVGYDAPGSRTRMQAIKADLRQTVRDLPQTARTVVKAAKVARQKRKDLAASRASRSGEVGVAADETVVIPSIAVYVDAAEWDARAESLGGNSYSLLAGVAAKFAERLQRRRVSDGAVTLVIAINLRESLDDDRALAMAFANATVDPEKVTIDLSEARAAVKVAREAAKAQTDPTMELLSLIPWLPRSAVKLVAELLFAYSDDLPVSCSNLGELPPQLAQLDGTDAEYVFIRALDQNVTRSEMIRSHGQLVVVSGRINGKVTISVEAYQNEGENSKPRLRELAAETMAEFGLTAVID